jgi:tRNA dimethylallyltransferase
MAAPLIAVLGPTAAGKSELAAHLAQALGGEVLSADAMAVYRGIDLATAKPDARQRALAPHRLIDLCEPWERCDAARWHAAAEAAVADAHARGVVPVVCGGTPLYVKLLLEGLTAGAPRDAGVRAALDARWQADAHALFAELTRLDPAYAAGRHPNDRRRVVRALEVHALTGQPYSSFHTTDGQRHGRWRTLLLGLHWERAALYARCDARAAALFAAGLVDEVRALGGRISPEARQAVGVKEVLDHLAGTLDRAACVALVAQRTRNLAKHQWTWWRRFPDIVWLPGDASDVAAQAMARARAFLAGEPADGGVASPGAGADTAGTSGDAP